MSELVCLTTIEGTLVPRVENTGWEYIEPEDKGVSTGLIIGGRKTKASIDRMVFARHNRTRMTVRQQQPGTENTRSVQVISHVRITTRNLRGLSC